MTRMPLALATCFVLLAGDATAQQPPGFFTVTEVGKDFIVVKGTETTSHRCLLSDLEISDAGGRRLTADDLLKRVRVGSIVVVSVDEKRIDPSYLRVLKDDTVVLAGVTVVLAKAESPGRGWTLDLEKMKASGEPVSGKLLGVDVKLDSIQLLNTGLALRFGQDLMHIFLQLKPGQGIEGKTFEFDAGGQQGANRPAIHLHMISATKTPSVGVHSTGYAMKLEFGKERNGRIPGTLYLCLPDEKKSWISGTFSLTLQ